MTTKARRTGAILALEIPKATPEIDTNGIPWCDRRCAHSVLSSAGMPDRCELSKARTASICAPGVSVMAGELPAPKRHTCSRCHKQAFNTLRPGLPPEGLTIKLFGDDGEPRDGPGFNSRKWTKLCSSCVDEIFAVMRLHPDAIPF